MSRPFLLESPEILEGIGTAHARSLAGAQIANIGTLFRAGAPAVHHICEGSGKRQVGRWFCAAALLRIDGITPDLAEVFVRAGVRSVRRVSELDLAELEAKLRAADPERALDVYALARMQRSAGERLADGLFFGRILSSDRQPIGGVKVDLGELEATTDAKGWFAFDSLPARTYFPRVALADRLRPLQLHQIRVAEGRLFGPVVVRAPAGGQRPAPVEVRELDGHRIVNTRSTRMKLSDKPLAEFPAETLFEVRKLAQGKAKLLSLYLVKIDFTIFVERADVRETDLPGGSAVGSILLWENGRLSMTAYTRADVNRRKREAAIAARTRRRILRLTANPGEGVVHLG